MKKLFTIALMCAFALTGCSKYDDSAVRKDIDDLDGRFAALEEWQKTVNANIGALQTLVAALEAKNFVTGVTPVVEGGETVGYTVTFTKNPTITIYHGKKGDKGGSGRKGRNRR